MSGGLISGLRRLATMFGTTPTKNVGPMENPPRPDIPVAVIGDIHGRFDLLEMFLERRTVDGIASQLVFVGDYVDRGPQSRAVLQRLRDPLLGAVCLKGNHEVMLCEFLDDPVEKGGRWLRNGGFSTLESYGIHLDENPTTSQLEQALETLSEALSDGTLDWLRGLPLYWQSGNLVVTHAGPNPARPIGGQEDRDFLWGHTRFLRDDRQDGIWVGHGHWSRDRPSCANGRINVDTGAWRSGRLTAALIETDGSVRFLTVR